MVDDHSPYRRYLLETRQLNGWHVEELLGSGGFGAVAKVRKGDTVGALKLTDSRGCQKEASILARHGGQTIPMLLEPARTVADLEVPAGYYVMELAKCTLAAHLGDRKPVFSTETEHDHYAAIDEISPYRNRERCALRVADAILDALGSVGNQIHGDICPNNILLYGSAVDTEVKVADWGSSRVYSAGKTLHTLLPGKDMWAPPSVLTVHNGGAVDDVEGARPTVDIYGLGAVVCWILTGTVPDWRVRWSGRDRRRDRSGLPLDRVDSAWHEFLTACTHADYHRRPDRVEAGRLLARVENAILLRGDVQRPVPTPDVGSFRTFVYLAVITLAAASLAALIITKESADDRASSSPATSTTTRPTLPPNDTCHDAERLCVPAVADALTPAAGTTEEGIIPSVRAWYRGDLTRREWQRDKPVDRDYDDVAAVRFNMWNPADYPRSVEPDRFGLVVATAPDAPLPPNAYEFSRPGVSTKEIRLAWLPPMPKTMPDNPYDRTLLPAWELASKVTYGDEYPYTAVFDLSSTEPVYVVGIASGAAHRSSATTSDASVTTFVPANQFPETVTDIGQLYGDVTFAVDDTVGACYIDLGDVGLGHGAVSCDHVHFGETQGTAYPAYGPDDDVLDAFAAACQEAFGDTVGLDPATYSWWGLNSSKPASDGRTPITCAIEPAQPGTLWNDPVSRAATSG